MLMNKGFYHLQQSMENNYGYRTRCFKICFQKICSSSRWSTGEVLGNKIANKIVKPKYLIDENPRNVEEIPIPPEKREVTLNEKEFKQVL